MDVNADYPFQAVSFEEVLTYIGFVFVVLLLEVHVAVIVSAGCSQLALSHLVHQAGSGPFNERFSEFS
jgi:hypothetical protein